MKYYLVLQFLLGNYVQTIQPLYLAKLYPTQKACMAAREQALAGDPSKAFPGLKDIHSSAGPARMIVSCESQAELEGTAAAP